MTVPQSVPAFDVDTRRLPVRGIVPAVRPLMVTFGSIGQPRGGSQARARLTAEVFASIGVPLAVVSTSEPVATDPNPWATVLRVPRGRASLRALRELVALIRSEAAGCTVLMITNATLMLAVALSRVRLPVIWDTNECQSLHYKRLPPTFVHRAKYFVWLGLEAWVGRRCHTAVAIGETEKANWRAAHPALDAKLVVVDHAPLVVEREAAASRRALVAQLGRPLDGPVLLFLGTLTAKQNAAAAKWILEHLVPSLPSGATMVFCGPGSDDLPQDPLGVVVGLGSVDDVDSVVAAADLCLAPLAAGAGVKTKVLHYLSHGKRVVGTPLAFEGLADAPGLYWASLEEFPAVVARLCHEPVSPEVDELRGRAQKQWVDRNHGRAHITEQWKKVLACLPMS